MVCLWAYLKFSSTKYFPGTYYQMPWTFLVLCCQNSTLLSFFLGTLKHNFLFFLTVTFSISKLALLHTDGHFSPSLDSTPVFGHKEPDQNIPRKESHRLAIPLTDQSSWLGCLRKNNYSINKTLKCSVPLRKKTTQTEEWGVIQTSQPDSRSLTEKDFPHAHGSLLLYLGFCLSLFFDILYNKKLFRNWVSNI